MITDAKVRSDVIRLVVLADDGTPDIEYDPVPVELENEFTVTAGLKANVNTVLVTAGSLAGMRNDDGSIATFVSLEFWWAGAPGTEGISPVLWSRWTVVDVEALEVGQLQGDPGRVQVTLWRLYLADRRHRFEAPRGGIVVAGELNRQPFDEAKGIDKNGNTLRSTPELVNVCLAAMGLAGELKAPASLSDATPALDVQWFGSHAPTELAKLLDAAGWAFILRQDGGFRIERIGEGAIEDPPNPPIVAGGITIPQPVDRRGGVVIFTSAPTPALDTIVVSKLAAGGFRFVCPDEEGFWTTTDKIDYLTATNKSVEEIIHNDFADVPEAFRDLARRYLCRCIRLDDAFGKLRLTRQVERAGRALGEYQVKAKVAHYVTKAGIRTADDLIPVKVVRQVNPQNSGTILMFEWRLGNVGTDIVGEHRLDENFTLLGPGEFEATVTTEARFKDDGRPKYFFCGSAASCSRSSS